MDQFPLPLWRRVVFVDWHGVLSRDPFWTSILQSERHVLRERLQAKLNHVFAQPVSHQWMKGYVTSEQIIHDMALELPQGYREDFLRRRLDEDCRQMKVNVPLFELLGRVRDAALVVIATDNMDCFKEAFEHVRQARRPPTGAAERLVHWARHCDYVICSSDERALKAEDPVGFFGPFLGALGLTFEDAALIDDRLDNCEAFADHGGTPLRYAMKTDDVDPVERSLQQWLREPTHAPASASAIALVGTGSAGP